MREPADSMLWASALHRPIESAVTAFSTRLDAIVRVFRSALQVYVTAE